MHFIRKRGDWLLGSSVAAVLIACMAMVWWGQMPSLFPGRSGRTAGGPEPEAPSKRSEPAEPPPLPAGVAVSPELTPEQVVRTVLNAMAHNDKPAPDTGVAVAFAFASPRNKAQTGPFPRFAAMVKNPAYLPMLNHTSAKLGRLHQRGNEVQLPVELTFGDGKVAAYTFILGKQTEGPQKDCWMTEGVMLMGGSSPPSSQGSAPEVI